MREGGTAAREVEAAFDRCLNCGAGLTGAFCSRCGQRAIPADPTVAEIAGDVWQELSGYDGRIAATFRNLLHPGRLTARISTGPPSTLPLADSAVLDGQRHIFPGRRRGADHDDVDDA
jgi:hypothetical protein